METQVNCLLLRNEWKTITVIATSKLKEAMLTQTANEDKEFTIQIALSCYTGRTKLEADKNSLLW